jgi:hypothetical protein
MRNAEWEIRKNPNLREFQTSKILNRLGNYERLCGFRGRKKSTAEYGETAE